jgi:hypothetical protein
MDGSAEPQTIGRRKPGWSGPGALSFLRTTATLGLWLAVASCGGGSPEAERPDAASPADALRVAAVPLPASFLLRNQTGRSIYVQRHRHFELVRDGHVFPVVRGCCGGLECGMALEMADEVAPDADYPWTWDGRALSSECAYAQPLPPGPLTVRVQYSFTRMGDEGLSYVGATVAVDQAFVHPPAAIVEVVAR